MIEPKLIRPECRECLSWDFRKQMCLRIAHGMACVVGELPMGEDLASRTARWLAEVKRREESETTAVYDAKPGLPTEAAARKNVPIYSGVMKYFPDAIAAVAACSKAGNDQHHPGEPLHWDRSKSTDELDALQRHLMEAGTIDTDGIRHSAKVAWRALANLQKEIEKAALASVSDPVEAQTFGPLPACSHSWVKDMAIGAKAHCIRCMAVEK